MRSRPVTNRRGRGLSDRGRVPEGREQGVCLPDFAGTNPQTTQQPNGLELPALGRQPALARQAGGPGARDTSRARLLFYEQRDGWHVRVAPAAEAASALAGCGKVQSQDIGNTSVSRHG